MATGLPEARTVPTLTADGILPSTTIASLSSRFCPPGMERSASFPAASRNSPEDKVKLFTLKSELSSPSTTVYVVVAVVLLLKLVIVTV